MPDTTGLDLREQERYWQYVSEGREAEYHGIAIHPQHLSLWERLVQGRHHNYDPVKDRQAKINELRTVWQQMQRENFAEKGGLADGSGVDPDEASFVNADVVSYFESESSTTSRTGLEKR